MTAAEPNPPLKVLSVDMLDGESDKVLLRCEHPNACLPFYVLVHWGQPDDETRIPAGPDQTRTRRSRLSRPENLLVRSGKFVNAHIGRRIHSHDPAGAVPAKWRTRTTSQSDQQRIQRRVCGTGNRAGRGDIRDAGVDAIFMRTTLHNPGNTVGCCDRWSCRILFQRPACFPRSRSLSDPQKTRADYVARMQQQTSSPPADVYAGQPLDFERRIDQFAGGLQGQPAE